MTHLSNGITTSKLNDPIAALLLSNRGYTIRHIETHHDTDTTLIVWDLPEATRQQRAS